MMSRTTRVRFQFLLSCALIISVSVVGTAPAWARKDLPAVNDEGMELIKNSDLATVYADPGADLGIYNRVMLLDATVAFKKTWKRDQNRGNSLRVKDRDMVKIENEVAELFHEVFTRELEDSGYEIVEQAGENVLLVKPAIVDLDVAAPDIQTSGITRNYSDSAGEMTLKLELFDSITNDKIAEATDRKRDNMRGHMEWRTRVTNRMDAKRMMSEWARALRSALDEARSSKKPTED